MKMVMAIIPRDQAGAVLECLIKAGHTATFSDSRGGVLRQAQQMLFIAVKKSDLETVLHLIRQSCHAPIQVESSSAPRGLVGVSSATQEMEVGGAVIFVWDLDRFEIC